MRGIQNIRRSIGTYQRSYRPYRKFPGTHFISRDYKIFHYTSEEAAKAIEKDGQLKPGNGNWGNGIYVTKIDPSKGYSKDEVKIAVRHEGIPDDRISHVVELDTDDLDDRSVSYEAHANNTVFIDTSEALDIKDIAVIKPNPLVKP